MALVKNSKTLYEFIQPILEEKGITFKSLAKKMKLTEAILLEQLKAKEAPAVQRIFFIKQLASALEVEERTFHMKDSVQNDLIEKVRFLLRKKNISFIELAKKINYSNAGLHRAFNNNTISISMLEAIAIQLDVDVSYFFESSIIERMADEIMKHKSNPTLKEFMFGFSRDISKGEKLEIAVGKNMNPDWPGNLMI